MERAQCYHRGQKATLLTVPRQLVVSFFNQLVAFLQMAILP